MHRTQENIIDPKTLDFHLPEELIAQEPTQKRDQARLMVLHRSSGKVEHRLFSELADYLKPGDLMVLNKARVSRAKVIAKKSTGGRVEIIFLKERSDGLWSALARPLLKAGTEIVFESGGLAVQCGRDENGENLFRFERGSAKEIMAKEGRVPLPPYIKRHASDPRIKTDEENYQTIYASEPGSVAAPTAGLHFSPELLSTLRTKGVDVVEILLHVGWGTFRPISGDVSSHTMLAEQFEVTPEAFARIQGARKEGRRIISVGTTSTRVLESLPLNASFAQLKAETSIFIKPGFSFQWIQGLVTNLHVPRSTPISLTAAFAGFEYLEAAYAEAIQRKYRFYSYGDAMLVI